MIIPREPLLSLQSDLLPSENELVDVTVLLHNIGVQVVRNPNATACKLGEILPHTLPVKTNSIFFLYIYSNFLQHNSPSQQDLTVTLPRESYMRVKPLSEKASCPANLLSILQRDRSVIGFVNGARASFADAFVILELVSCPPFTHVAILIQSKRRESPEERAKVDKEFCVDYCKTIADHMPAFFAAKLFPLYVYISDSDEVDTGISVHIHPQCVLNTFCLTLWVQPAQQQRGRG